MGPFNTQIDHLRQAALRPYELNIHMGSVSLGQVGVVGDDIGISEGDADSTCHLLLIGAILPISWLSSPILRVAVAAEDCLIAVVLGEALLATRLQIGRASCRERV